MTSPLLSINKLSIALPQGAERPYAVENVSLEVQASKITCVVGESGSGKSMIAKSILDILPDRGISITQGSIRLNDRELVGIPVSDMKELRGVEAAMIFQEPMTALNPLHRIGDQISEVLKIHTDMKAPGRREKVLAILDDVNLPNPEAIYRAYPHQLSGGQRQRVMIAMALILEPALIIADEPTTALDVTTQAQILRLIAKIQRSKGTGVLFITHDFGVVAEIADSIVVMQKGKVVEDGQRDTILNSPQHPYTRELISAVPGLSIAAQPKEPEPPILEVSKLSKTFRSGGGLFGIGHREVHAVKEVSLTLAKGETLGIIGESGSGKSSLARLIIRLIDADAGSVKIDGREFLTLPPSELVSARSSIQMAFQDPFASLNPRRKVRSIISESLSIIGHKNPDTRIAELLAVVGLPPAAADRFPHEFSGGQRQRIGIARALAQEPDILIADEVVSALDVSVQKKVLDLLQDIQLRFGLSILFITHDLCVAAQICDRIVVMNNGVIVESGYTHTILKQPEHHYTVSLLESIPGRGWLNERN